jgi:hypothetical protein
MENLHKPESLSLEELRILLKELNPLDEDAADSFTKGPSLFGYAPEMIYFDQITNLDQEIASLLSPLRRQLSLRNVLDADLESLKKLMEVKVGTGSLSSRYYEFNTLEIGIEALDEPRATILNKSNGNLSLPNLKQIDPKSAAKLRGIPWNLLLGIETIDAETAAALVDLPKKSTGRSLHLPNLKKCDTESLKILASVASDYSKNPTAMAYLILGFEEIDVEQARILSTRNAHLSADHGYRCNSLPRLRNGSVEFFAVVGDSWAKDTSPTLNPIYFDALERLTAAEAETLVSRVRSNVFSLNGLKQLESGVAEQLSKFRTRKDGHLTLKGLQSLTAEDAEHLGKLSGVDYLSLNGLQMVTPEVAAGLAGFSGNLILGFKSICDDSARELAKQGSQKSGKEKGHSLCLDGLTKISDKSAKELSNYTGGLSLNGLNELSDKAAEELSKFKGAYLNLNGLNELSDKAAEELSRFKGNLNLKGLSKLSDKAAAELSKFQGQSLGLYGLSELSDRVAQSLAKYQGHLGLEHELQCLMNVLRSKLES